MRTVTLVPIRFFYGGPMGHIFRYVKKTVSRRGFLWIVGWERPHFAVKGPGWARAEYARVKELLIRSIEEIQEALEPETMLAFRLNDKDPSPDNGFPLRRVISRMYAYKGVKWVERIVFTERQEVGYWETSGYPVDGSIPGFER